MSVQTRRITSVGLPCCGLLHRCRHRILAPQLGRQVSAFALRSPHAASRTVGPDPGCDGAVPRGTAAGHGCRRGGGAAVDRGEGGGPGHAGADRVGGRTGLRYPHRSGSLRRLRRGWLRGGACPRLVLSGARRQGALGTKMVRTRTGISPRRVESLTKKSQLLEVELERTTKQLKEAISIAGEETAKCKAAKEVIKSLTAQLKGMAERLPGGAAKNTKLPPLPGISIPNDISSMGTESLGSPSSSGEQITNSHNGLLASNGTNSVRTKTIHEVGKNGTRLPDAESCHEAEWVEQDEPGVYITLTALPGGARDLKRVRFSRKRFSETQAEQWWQENRARVYQQYNVRVVDKSTASVDNDIASN